MLLAEIIHYQCVANNGTAPKQRKCIQTEHKKSHELILETTSMTRLVN